MGDFLIQNLQVPDKTFSKSEVSTHNKDGDLWVILFNRVYDLSKFANLHPAGRNVLLDYAGQDCTQLFEQFHSETIIHKYHQKLCIGKVQDSDSVQIYSPINEFQNTSSKLGIPYGDPNWCQGFNSPYYNDSHTVFRIEARKFAQEHISPYVDQWDMDKKIPLDVMKTLGHLGCFAVIIGKPFPKKYFKSDTILGVDVDKLDYFHELVLIEESMKGLSNGVIWGFGSIAIALPPLLNYGSEFLKDKYVSQVLYGEKIISLAVTEPWAGSDVAGIQTTATLTEDGKFYIVNGMKKFITSGAYADIFTTAVRTDEDKYFGVSLLIIEKSMPGVKTRPMNMQGAWGSGTGFIVFENVKVPVENLIGDEGSAFLYIMNNFNHERFQVTIECLGASRLMVEECMRYAHNRNAFGKKLIDQPVIKQKLAYMIKETESLQAWLEQIAYNLQRATEKHNKILAGAIGICKAHSTIVLENILKEAVQIFGGNGYQRGSVGSKVERYYRDMKSLTLGGGAPEIMFDMAIRMSGGLMPRPKI
ncbi:Cytochrome b5-like heme/steroid binding domain [Pseudocohnilembus persalinus]|uniref:Cytochrome b5-like heme/steroid binding domain n=1 Tax=Pseudocohnilembus persalinus TaxID=266149 RepID=A0A0V0QF47_PSEPJ|nr:Cytochrome b5-like heme/steroid binding domain [Pseudocohnilembus persalinus]|eukprot:KRX00823.1 Cytochrome b5-like heme/steroid binding domain [Pseudocohnilembus persalinus]